MTRKGIDRSLAREVVEGGEQLRGAAHRSRFRQCRRQGKENRRLYRSEKGQLRSWEPLGEGEGCLLCSPGAPETENPTGRLHLEAISCMSPVGREIKMEIPV